MIWTYVLTDCAVVDEQGRTVVMLCDQALDFPQIDTLGEWIAREGPKLFNREDT
jgi:hypothetical protein